MRTIRNLAWFLLAFTLTFWAGLASAQTRDYYWRTGPNVAEYVSRSTPEASCQAYLAERSIPYGETRYVSNTQYGCYRKTTGANQSVTVTTRQQCPTLKPAFDGDKNQCILPDDPPPRCDVPQGTKFRFTVYRGSSAQDATDSDPKTRTPYPTSSPKCYLTGVPSVTRCYSTEKDGKRNYYCEYEGVSDGNPVAEGQGPLEGPPPTAADPRVDHPPTEAPDGGSCPKGTVNAGLSASGIPMCIGSGTDPKNTPPAPPKIETEKTDTAEDGTKTTTKTETIKNADGTETTTTTVTIVKPDGTKLTNQDKTTTNKPDGSPGKDDSTKEDEKYDLCKQNPNLTICQNSSVSGKCGEISCTGDAIQCATLRAAAAMQCQQQKDLEDLAKAPGLGLGNAIAQGSDPMQGAIDNALKGTEIDLSKPALDSSGFVGAGACLAPITMTVVGRPVTASFESVCQNIQPLRYAIMACAYILVYLLVSRSILQG